MADNVSALPVSVEAGASPREGLVRRRARVVAPARGERQLTARERVEELCDAGTFFEPAPLRRQRGVPYGGKLVDRDGDGVIAGVGRVDGRPVVVVSHDFTVAGGSIGSAFADS